MDSELDRTHPLDGEWDEKTCREWEEWLDSLPAQEPDQQSAQEL